MDDSCAVCADSLEWVAYGLCGHRDVCSTCVARLRFICEDRRCCICKSECDIVFVTKALGDYTRTVSDFSTFPAQVKEGQVGSYWYHEDTQAFFDDFQHYKMIRAMCRLSCSICDRDDPTKNHSFRNIGHLKRHLSNQHAVRMCHLCLESRKVFICEQKLYTRAQLNRHMRTGDSEVDGIESERGGFAGHPMCEFCRSPFYGENELYSHMSTEHYTCHICQRRHPGQYEYYKDYDDLEIHFRHDHYLCEDEACLGKKFIVFQTEADLKRHNAMEHGGRMSRSKRNAVLQIPTSFRYRSSNESGQERGRRRTFRRESSPDHELSMAIEASLDRASGNDPVAGADSSGGETLVQPFEAMSMCASDSEPSSSRYRQAVAQTSSNASLTESLFPPLSASGSTQQKTQQHESQNTMAALLRRQNKATVLNVGQPRPPPSAAWPAPSPSPAPTAQSSHMKPAPVTGSALSSSYATSLHGRTVNDPPLGGPTSWASRNRLNHSNSAPNLTEKRYFDPVSDFPPVSQAQAKPNKLEDVQTANKSLVERMRIALDYDEDKYSAFKEISQEYRQGLIGTWEYLGFVKQFNLTHLVLDLARLCPDVDKQKELIEAYNTTCQSSNERRDKGKKVMNGGEQSNSSKSKEELVDKLMTSVKSLQLQQLKQNNGGGEVQVLEKDGYRVSKDKGKGKEGGEITSGSKQKKKTSKFHRIRLGDDSAASVLQVRNGNSADTHTQPSSASSSPSVWQSGGAHRLFAK